MPTGEIEGHPSDALQQCWMRLWIDQSNSAREKQQFFVITLRSYEAISASTLPSRSRFCSLPSTQYALICSNTFVTLNV